MVTRTRVVPADPAFTRPTKPIGRNLTEAEACVMIDHGETWENRGGRPLRGWQHGSEGRGGAPFFVRGGRRGVITSLEEDLWNARSALTSGGCRRPGAPAA